MSDSVKRDTNVEALKDRVPLSALIGRTHKLTKNGREVVTVCPFHADRNASLTINDDKGFYHCFPCGAHGDHVDWLKEVDGLSFFGARDRLMELAGVRAEDVDKLPPAKPKKTPEELAADRAKKIGAGLKRWRWTVPPAGTLVETYLTQGRALRMDQIGFSRRIRFGMVDYWWQPPKNPDGSTPPPVCLGRWPAMVIALQNAPGLPDFSDLTKPHGLVGAHVTWLSDDGLTKRVIPHPLTGKPMKPRKIYGYARGAAMRLYPPAETMAVGEGGETVLSARMAGWRDIPPGELSVWGGISLDNISGAALDRGEKHPDPEKPRAFLKGLQPDPDDPGLILPPECKRVLLIEDNDSGDPHVAKATYRLAAIKWRAAGIEVWRIRPPLGSDLNNVAQWDVERDDG